MKLFSKVKNWNSERHRRLSEACSLVILVVCAGLLASCTNESSEDLSTSSLGNATETTGPVEQIDLENLDFETTANAVTPVSLEALNLEIEILSFEFDANFDQRTRELADGTFQFRPADDAVPTGSLVLNFSVDDVDHSIETSLSAIVQVGGEFPYYLFETENGRMFQSVRNALLPFVSDAREFEDLNLDQAKQLYLNGTSEERESALWEVWKLNSGEEIAPIVGRLKEGEPEEMQQSASIIAAFEIHHPLVTQAIQSQLEALLHYSGPVDGSFSDETMAAIRQFQEVSDLRVTGSLTEETLTKMFNSERE